MGTKRSDDSEVYIKGEEGENTSVLLYAYLRVLQSNGNGSYGGDGHTG